MWALNIQWLILKKMLLELCKNYIGIVQETLLFKLTCLEYLQSKRPLLGY
jgi:hypothetical protein